MLSFHASPVRPLTDVPQEPTYPRFLPGNLLSAFATHASEYAELARAYVALDEARLGEILRKNDPFRRVRPALPPCSCLAS